MLDEKTLNEIQALIDKLTESASLLQIKTLVDIKLDDVKQVEIEQFLAKANELQRNFGIEATDLATALSSNRGKGLRVKDKYRNPKNPNESWAGRGKQPAWIAKYLADNPTHTLNNLLVDSPKAETKPVEK